MSDNPGGSDPPETPDAEGSAPPSSGTTDGGSSLERALGYVFARPELLVEALTHRSYVHEFPGPGVSSNERLEFLGDAVLALISADLLFSLAPASDEGELTAIRAALVRASTLAGIARQLNLGQHLRLGRGEDVTGGRTRELLLASALEAVLGAVYRDGGLSGARAFIEPYLKPTAMRLLASRRYKDDKSVLQELAQAQLGVTPSYRLISAEGPAHAPRFIVEVLLGDRVLARGDGQNKRQAEQAAAREALRDPGWQTAHDESLA
jgi:ribonuclease III